MNAERKDQEMDRELTRLEEIRRAKDARLDHLTSQYSEPRLQLKRDLSFPDGEFYFLNGAYVTKENYTLSETVMIVRTLRNLNISFENRTDMNFDN